MEGNLAGAVIGVFFGLLAGVPVALLVLLAGRGRVVQEQAQPSAPAPFVDYFGFPDDDDEPDPVRLQDIIDRLLGE